MKKNGSALLFVMLATALITTIGVILVQQHSFAQCYAIERGKRVQRLWAANALVMYGVACLKEGAFKDGSCPTDFTLDWQKGKGQLTFEAQGKHRKQITAAYYIDNRVLGKSSCTLNREGNVFVQEQIQHQFH